MLKEKRAERIRLNDAVYDIIDSEDGKRDMSAQMRRRGGMGGGR